MAYKKTEMGVAVDRASAPPPGTAERWAWDYVTSLELDDKLASPPRALSWEAEPPARRLDRPGRPSQLTVSDRATRTPRPGALVSPRRRAQLVHTFVHHELQAAELMCWAMLCFPDTPLAFRRGLLSIASDEIRHMRMYLAHLGALGFRWGDFSVRDWFWERVPRCSDAAAFVATLGIGFEGGNLDHSARFAALFRAAGDARGAALVERIGAEEVAHVRFALRWYRTFTGDDELLRWAEHLPAPLSPTLMRGRRLDRGRRLEAGMSERFVAELERARTTA
jgi:uncharacterized ferritin-like protein (DUF455 family)